MQKLLIEQIRIISHEQGELLKADKLAKKYQIETGLYLICEHERYVALDFSERQSWYEYFGSFEGAPEGYCSEFKDPLNAIDWLLNLKS